MMSHAQPRPMLAQPETSTLQGLVSHLQGLRETTPSGFFQILGHSSVVFTLYIYIYVDMCMCVEALNMGTSHQGPWQSSSKAGLGFLSIFIYIKKDQHDTHPF